MKPMLETPGLKRGLTLWLLTFYGLGNILGAGIYVLVGEVAGSAGLFAPVSFLIAALVAGFTAQSYAELSTRFPFSAGEAVYIREGLSYPWLSILVGLLIILMGAVSAAAISRGFVGYLQVLVAVPDIWVITLLLMSLGALAVWGIREAVMAAAMLTLVEAGGLVLVLVVGVPEALSSPVPWSAMLPPPEWPAWNGILFGAVLAFYAFIGFEDMVNVAEEVREPGRTLPRAILLALAIATLLYAAISLVAVRVVAPEVLAGSEAPLALLYSESSGRSPWLLGIIGMLAVINGALIQIIMGSRVLYGMSRQGWLPDWLGRVSARTRTPVAATLLVTCLVLALALWLPLVALAQITSLLVLAIFSLVNLSLLRIRARETAPGGDRTASRWMPWLGLFSSLGLIGYQMADWLVSHG